MTKTGVLLVVSVKDAMHSIIPICLALVPVENGEHWSWVLSCLLESRLKDWLQQKPLTVLSDRHKGERMSLSLPRLFALYEEALLLYIFQGLSMQYTAAYLMPGIDTV